MNDDMRVLGGVVAGAAIGGVAAHLLLTNRGRQTLQQLRPALEHLSDTLQDVRLTLERLNEAIREGRRVTVELRSTTVELRTRAR